MTPLLEHTIREFVGSAQGWTTPERCVEMADLILNNDVNLAVEIGVFGGRTFISQALAMKEKGKGRIYGIDPWKVEPALEGENAANQGWWKMVDFHDVYKRCIEAVWRYGLDEHAITIRACGQHCPQLFDHIDILNVDANHSEVASCRDVQLYVPKVRKGGYVWMDDCDWPSTQRAQEIIKQWCVIEKDCTKYRLYKRC